jgi:curved DNA-binding protein CbpA
MIKSKSSILIITKLKGQSFKIVSRAYETLKNPESRSTYDQIKNTQGFTASEFSAKTSSAHQSNSRSENFYSKAQQHGYSSAYAHQQAWEEFHHQKRSEEAMRNRQYQSSQSTSRSIFDRLSVRLGIVAAIFFLFDLWRRENKAGPDQVLPFIEAGESFIPKTPKIDPVITRDQVSQEMKNKQFRVEYQTVQINISPEAAQAQKTYKKEKKVAGLDAFVQKQNFTLKKSQDLFVPSN